jgi:CheY-like chemotaxis protein
MGGTMQLESGLGAGSRFTFTVALRPADMTVTAHRPAIPGQRILVVDANGVSRSYLTAYLLAEGAWVIAGLGADDVQALLDANPGIPLDAIVVNPSPGDSERERLLAQLRAIPRLRRVPCIGLAARLHVSGDPAYAEFAAVVPKPVKRATLLAALAKACAGASAAAS